MEIERPPRRNNFQVTDSAMKQVLDTFPRLQNTKDGIRHWGICQRQIHSKWMEFRPAPAFL